MVPFLTHIWGGGKRGFVLKQLLKKEVVIYVYNMLSTKFIDICFKFMTTSHVCKTKIAY
jgi:hypothetical protein